MIFLFIYFNLRGIEDIKFSPEKEIVASFTTDVADSRVTHFLFL